MWCRRAAEQAFVPHQWDAEHQPPEEEDVYGQPLLRARRRAEVQLAWLQTPHPKRRKMWFDCKTELSGADVVNGIRPNAR